MTAPDRLREAAQAALDVLERSAHGGPTAYRKDLCRCGAENCDIRLSVIPALRAALDQPAPAAPLNPNAAYASGRTHGIHRDDGESHEECREYVAGMCVLRPQPDRWTDRQGRVHDHEYPELTGRAGCSACEARLATAESTEMPRDPWAEAMADPAFVAGMERGRADFEAGRVRPWADIKAEAAAKHAAKLPDRATCPECGAQMPWATAVCPRGHVQHGRPTA